MKGTATTLSLVLRTALPVLLGLFAMAGGSLFGGVETIELQVDGTGTTYADAVNAGLTEAIAQNTGKNISTTTELNRLAASIENSKGTKGFVNESLAESVKTATKGEVLGYSVLGQSQGSDGVWNVRLSVRLARFKRSEQVDRIRVAVAEFRPGASDADFARLATASAKSALVQTRKFAVLDRDWEREAGIEENIITGGSVPREERARLGQRLGADLVLVATVNELWTDPNVGEGSKLLMPMASAVVNFRLVDFATGQVKLAKVSKLAVSRAQVRSADRTGNLAAAKSVLAEKFGTEIADAVTEAAYPITIVSTGEEGEVVLNQGGDRLKVGSHYGVYAMGDAITDPQTGESLGRVERYAGAVEIVRVTPKMSYARTVEQKAELKREMILRKQAALAAKPDANKSETEKDKEW